MCDMVCYKTKHCTKAKEAYKDIHLNGYYQDEWLEGWIKYVIKDHTDSFASLSQFKNHLYLTWSLSIIDWILKFSMVWLQNTSVNPLMLFDPAAGFC